MSTSGAAPAGGPPSGAAGGDLGGVYPAPSVVGLQGRGVSATAPTDTQGLIWNNALGLWVPTSLGIPAASNLVTGPDAFGAAAVVGTAATFSKGDHNHGLPADPTPAFAAPTIALGTAAVAGAAGTIIRSDATIAAFDATVPVVQAFGDAAGAGAAAVTARRDHRHGMPATPVTSLNGGTGAIAQTNGYGVAGANSNPPAPAVALTSAAAVLGANVNVPTATVQSVLSSPALAVGVWDVTAQGLIAATATAGQVEFKVDLGTATATFGGPVGAESLVAANGNQAYTVRVIVTVTVAGTLSLFFFQSSGTTYVATAVTLNRGWAATGITAVRIA